MFDIKTLALLKHGKVWGAKNIVESALLNKWSGASYEKTVGPAPIISISDAKPKPAKSLIVGMEPIQAGSGDPSPDNIRPITGRTGVTVERTGKNLFDATSYPLTSGYINSSDGSVSAGGTSASKTVDYIPCGFLAGGTITINHRPGYGYSPGIAFYDADKTFISGVANNGSTSTDAWSMSVPSAAQYMRITVPYGQENIQIELGSTASDYEPYVGATFPVTWQTEAGTVYGGTVDVVSGVLTVTWVIIDLGTLTWTTYSSPDRHVFRADYPTPLPYVDSPTLLPHAICSAYYPMAYSPISASDNGAFSFGGERVVIIDHRFTDASLFATAVHGVQLCYELATPQTYQLTPTQIQLLKGSNTLWSDADDLTLTYLGTTPANLLGGMLGWGLGNPQEPTEETSEEPEAEPVSEEQESPPDEQETEETEEP